MNEEKKLKELGSEKQREKIEKILKKKISKKD